jgi:phospholipase C
MSCRFALAATLFAASACGFASTGYAASLGDVEHIIVIYLENHSFDNLFGFFPNADGIAAAGATKIQVDADGKPYVFLPQVDKAAGAVDDRFPKDLANQPFSIDAYVPIGEATGTRSIASSTRRRRSTAAAWISSSPIPTWARCRWASTTAAPPSYGTTPSATRSPTISSRLPSAARSSTISG